MALNTLPISRHLGTLCKRHHEFDGSGKSLRTKNNDCVECLRLSSKRYLHKNLKRHSDSGNAWQKRRRKERPFDAWCASIVFKSRKQGVPYDLDAEFLENLWQKQDKKCYWLNILIDLNAGNNDPYKANVDRLKPELGYVKGNIVWASRFANFGRANCSVEQFQQFLDNLKQCFR